MIPIPSSWELPVEIRERLGDRGGKQRAIVENGHLLLILHKLPQPGVAARESVFFWCDAAGDWKASTKGAGLGALKSHLEEYQREVDDLDAKLDVAQDATDLFLVLESAVPIYRAAKNQQAALQAARDALPDRHEIIALRDTAADIERAAELLEIDARNALNYHIARQNEEQSKLTLDMTRTGHRLNLLAALFLPLTAVTSIFGMGLPSGLEHAPTWVFWSVLAFGLARGCVLRGVFAGRDRE